ncbi:MAG: tetratricopeptide repeat protein [Coriobacteriia bacterium]|nr:tetratricopeptide repeat protein [Coriobacteriia bacterium]
MLVSRRVRTRNLDLEERMARESEQATSSVASDDAADLAALETVDSPKLSRTRRSRDPLIPALGVTIVLVIILTLTTVVYALLTGVFGTGAPRTFSEQRVVATAAKIEAGSMDRIDWMAYILALIDDGQYRKAQEWIDRGTAVLADQHISADMLYMQADLYFAQGDLDRALEITDEALTTIKETYEAEKAASEESNQPSRAVAFGISKNYWELLLLKAEILEERSEWEQALECYDEYLAGNETAATVYTLRGNLKEQLGDTAGAEADYRMTLQFIDGDSAALAGLERIGASR